MLNTLLVAWEIHVWWAISNDNTGFIYFAVGNVTWNMSQLFITNQCPEWSRHNSNNLKVLSTMSNICTQILIKYLGVKIFYFSIVDLQWGVHFYCIAKWLSYTYVYYFSYSFPLWFSVGYWLYSSLCYAVGPCCFSIL